MLKVVCLDSVIILQNTTSTMFGSWVNEQTTCTPPKKELTDGRRVVSHAFQGPSSPGTSTFFWVTACNL